MAYGTNTHVTILVSLYELDVGVGLQRVSPVTPKRVVSITAVILIRVISSKVSFTQVHMVIGPWLIITTGANSSHHTLKKEL